MYDLHAGIQKVLPVGVQLRYCCCFFWRVLCLFFFYEGREDPNSTKRGPSLACLLMAFCWQAYDGPTFNAGFVTVIFQGIWTSFANKPYIFEIFQGGGGFRPPVPPSGSAHDLAAYNNVTCTTQFLTRSFSSLKKKDVSQKYYHHQVLSNCQHSHTFSPNDTYFHSF